MGNAISPCFHPHASSSVKLVFYNGTTRNLYGSKHVAGEVMFEFPDQMVCQADAFYIGRPVPALGIDDKLVVGETYIVLPIDKFATSVISAASLASLSPVAVNFKQVCPFEYTKEANGKVLVRVAPEFITRIMTKDAEEGRRKRKLCSTPELRKHYDRLVGANKDQVWSPKLETISESRANKKSSPFSCIRSNVNNM
uniref:Uncharacterized protein n=1 Tax=Kalanchoe fedtschenkoi TaxID=63787 RepID=A0A7N0TI64_KALFE